MPALFTSIQAVLSLFAARSITFADKKIQIANTCHIACFRYASGRTTGIVLDSGDGVSHAVPVYEGFAMPSAIRRIDVAGRDVTEHLQVLLRKAGAVFHTSAEKEVVRLMKEKACYIASDPKKEEKEWAAGGGSGRVEEYRLPDGHVLRVRYP